jgi:hypothetical protein
MRTWRSPWSAEPGLFVAEPEALFDLGVGIGAFAGFDWGYHHWGTDWHGRDHQPDITGSRGFTGHAEFRDSHSAFARPGGVYGGAWHAQSAWFQP